MDYKDWLILKTIREEQSLTKAAERLFISQPALSYRLQNLEKEMGVAILTRRSTGVSFTPPGEYLVTYAEKTLQQLEEVKKHVQTLDAAVQGTLRLGVSSVVARFKMASLLHNYRKRYPEVEISLTTGSSTLQLPEMLRSREIDIAILRRDIDWPECKRMIAEEPMCIVSAQPIDLDRLPQIPWIQHEQSRITKSEKQLHLWWQERYHCPPPKIIEVDTIEACLQMVAYGHGWGIVPKIHIASRRRLHSCPVVWQDGSTMLVKTFMLYTQQALEHPASKLFIDYVLREYSS